MSPPREYLCRKKLSGFLKGILFILLAFSSATQFYMFLGIIWGIFSAGSEVSGEFVFRGNYFVYEGAFFPEYLGPYAKF